MTLTAVARPPRSRTRIPLLPLALLLGPVSVAVAMTVSLALGGNAGTVPAWAPAVALLAVVAGVPHGAVDHLALVVPPAGTRRAALAAAYVGAAALATAAVVLAPAQAFVAVLAMSVWHFGTGDVELADELAERTDRARWRRILHAAAAGSVPVLLPLTAPAAASTLAALEPRLAVLTEPSLLVSVRAVVLVLAAVAAVALVRERRTAAAAELALLVALALTVTPLVAFAVYFAGWHAARHTLRLALDDHGRLDRGRLLVVLRAGAPSLAVAAAAVAAALVTRAAPAPTVLWLALAAVWGLTVPHMAVVGALGARRRRSLSPRRPSPQAART